jgi:hypothetical protein
MTKVARYEHGITGLVPVMTQQMNLRPASRDDMARAPSTPSWRAETHRFDPLRKVNPP